MLVCVSGCGTLTPRTPFVCAVAVLLRNVVLAMSVLTRKMICKTNALLRHVCRLGPHDEAPGLRSGMCKLCRLSLQCLWNTFWNLGWFEVVSWEIRWVDRSNTMWFRETNVGSCCI